MSTEDKEAIKAAQMAVYADHYRQIELIKAALVVKEKEASDYAKGLVKDFGKGPHGMQVPNGDGTARPFVVTFQLVNKEVRPNVADVSQFLPKTA
jgi:hypothetical protein